MALIKVLIIFVVILALLNKRLPLYLAMIFGSLLMIVMFRLPLATAGQTALHTLTGWDVWSVNAAVWEPSRSYPPHRTVTEYVTSPFRILQRRD